MLAGLLPLNVFLFIAVLMDRPDEANNHTYIFAVESTFLFMLLSPICACAGSIIADRWRGINLFMALLSVDVACFII
jgi:hypothetical protein